MREQMEEAKTFEPQDLGAQVSWRLEEQKQAQDSWANDSNGHDCDLSDVNYQSSQFELPKPNEGHTTANKYLGGSPDRDDIGTRQPSNGPADSPDVLIIKQNREEHKAVKPPALDFLDWDERRKGESLKEGKELSSPNYASKPAIRDLSDVTQSYRNDSSAVTDV